MHTHSHIRRALTTLGVAASLVAAVSCEENLPNGPETFQATLRVRATGDTLIVGESRTVEAEAKDAAGNVVQGLTFNWTSSDTNIVALAAGGSADDAAAGRAKTLIARRTGRSTVTVSLPDSRFVVSNATRNATVVVGGVRVLSARDSTLTSINDTALAIASGLALVNGTLVPRASQGIRWIHLGVRTTVAGQGDTLRFIARSNGIDTLIATHDFCLAGAKCADTILARVSQRLFLTVAPRSFSSWSFSDTLGPTVTFADARGTGQAGTSVRLVPATAADSAIVRVTPPVGVSNPANGVMAVPRLVSQGNGTAKVRVHGIAAAGNVVATDSVTETVRQVARRIAVEPIRALMTEVDSLPINPIARDARGARIADANVSIESSDLPIHDIWAGPTGDVTVVTLMQMTPALSGNARPEANPGAPQIPVIVHQSLISVVPIDTVKSGATATPVTSGVLDSTATAAIGEAISFVVSAGPTAPGPVQVGENGLVTVSWIPYDSAGHYTLTGVRGAQPGQGIETPGRVVIRRSVEVIPGDPNQVKSTADISATTIATNGTATVTVTARDVFGNVVKTAVPSNIAASATRGTIGPFTCNEGICTATYTAPATTGPASLSVKINGVDILNSPIAVTIN